MTLDLTHFLHDFEFERGRVNARFARGDDGRELLQVRIELGVLQMECDGRPDGAASVLADILHGRSRALDAQLSAAIRLELGLLQQRAVAFLAVGDPVRAGRDADSILQGTELMIERGLSVEREWAEGARFSVLVLRTRCAASALMSTGRAREAAIAIEAGLRALREASDSIGIADSFDMLSDVVALRSMRDALVPQLPPAQRSELEARLRAAIVAENYELAAILRDELRML
ncbi:MAG: UvrB/UvrC motif-containing protein [Planctomycetota bacterium]